jgi:very-short-patch-repair endonuclease
MRTIYTDTHITVKDVAVRDVPRGKRAWVSATKHRLLAEATLPERIAAGMLAKLRERPVRQAFFIIRHREYFTDFFFPRSMLVVEIDGSVHKLKKEHDRRRDADFRSIGIRTIRIGNKDVMGGRLFDKLFKKLYK